MRAYLAGRLPASVFVIYAVSTLVFFLNRLAPGSPAATILRSAATPSSIRQLNQQLGLDEPMWRQYLSFLGHGVRGDFGNSCCSQSSASPV
jgi:peptide/nickel transport system permease protein